MCLQMTSDSVSAFQGKEELACKNKKSIENAQLAKKSVALMREKFVRAKCSPTKLN